jgi:anti-sigma regulatory factor (Ser/Thr protein kinase)
VVAAVKSKIFGVNSREVGAIDDWIDAIVRRWGLDERTALRARLCVGELAANLLEHAGARPEDHIKLTLRRLSDCIEIEFLDTCNLFDPTTVANPMNAVSVKDVSVGGRGLMLVRAFSRDLSYRIEGGQNNLTFNIPPE